MYVCTYVRTVISLKASWILIQCRHQMRIHTHTCTHIYLHAHMPTHSTPHTTTARRTKPGVKWGRVASSFPPSYCTQPGNDEVHYLAKNIQYKFLVQVTKYFSLIFIYYYLFLCRSARSIGLRQCLAIRDSCFSFLDPLDIW
jgi:hypothetical protein